MNQTGEKTETICPTCHGGYLHKFPQDIPGVLRCGRCGAPQEPKAGRQPAKTRKDA